MAEKSTRLSELIAAIADGEAIDWGQALADEAATAKLRRALLHLRTVAGVAEVHRSPTGNEELPRIDDALVAGVGGRGRRHVRGDGRAAASESGQWGHFILVEKIGEGTFGEVFHARDTWLDHAVALKLLKPERADLSRLLHEARTLAQIRHHHVVRVYGADRHEGRAGFWMEFIHGHTLEDVIANEGVRSANEAAIIGQDLCRALAAVHSKDIAHRDVKARNVMREFDTGRIVLMDFGAGELMKERVSGRFVAGTPLYLAPELFNASAATPQTDIYALGVLLFHLVTESYPVQGTSLEELFEAHERRERCRLDDVRPDLPDAFVRVVETMLARDPGQRYATAASARAALEAVVVPFPPALPPAPTGLAGTSTSRVISDLGRHTTDTHWQSRVLNMASVVALALVLLTFTGFTASTFYNRPLGRTGGFATESPFSWPIWGLRALLAAAVVMAGPVLAWTLVKSLCRLALALCAPLRRWCNRVSAGARRHFEPVRSAQTATIASVVLLAQIAVVVMFVWRFQALLSGLDGFIFQRSPTNLAVLGPENQGEHILFDVTLCVPVLAFGLVWYWLFRRTSMPSQADATGLVVVGITITAMSLLAFKIVPYRILYHNDAERVSYESQRCYLVAQRSDEARIFCPLGPPPWNRVLRIDDPALKREGITENLFTGLNHSF